MMQGAGEGLRSPATVLQGGSVNVDVGPNDASVEINVAGSGKSTSVKVEPGKTASIPVPPVPGGTALWITVGQGLRKRVILVEVIAPGP